MVRIKLCLIVSVINERDVKNSEGKCSKLPILRELLEVNVCSTCDGL